MAPSMRRLAELGSLLFCLLLLAACGGPGLATVSGTVEGEFICGQPAVCRQPIGIQQLSFRSDDTSQPLLATRSDAGGHYSIQLPAGTWTAYIGAGGVVKAGHSIRVAGFPGERITADLDIPIPVGQG